MSDNDEFERWWVEYDKIRTHDSDKVLAWAAWQASGTSEERQADWAKASAMTREASELAQRHGLCIGVIPETSDRWVEATRGSVVVARAEGWRKMIDKLNAMAERGEL